MENDFMQQPAILIVALIVSILVLMVTVTIVISMSREKDSFGNLGKGMKNLRKKKRTDLQ